MNRIAAGRLHDLSCVLGVPISFFIAGSPSELGDLPTAPRGMPPAEGRKRMDEDAPHRRETLNLVQRYQGVPDLEVRKGILDLVRSLAPDRQQ